MKRTFQQAARDEALAMELQATAREYAALRAARQPVTSPAAAALRERLLVHVLGLFSTVGDLPAR